MKVILAVVAIAIVLFPWNTRLCKYRLQFDSRVESLDFFVDDDDSMNARIKTRDGGWLCISRFDATAFERAKTSHFALNEVGDYKIWCGDSPHAIRGGTGTFKIFQLLEKYQHNFVSIDDLLANYAFVSELVITEVPEHPKSPRAFLFVGADGALDSVWCDRRKRVVYDRP